MRLLFLTLIFLSPFTSAYAQSPDLSGTWYNEHWVWNGKPQRDFLRLSIAHMQSDGTLDVAFYKCDKEGLELILENHGTWHLDGETLRSTYTRQNGIPYNQPVHGAYKLENFDGDILSYTALDRGNFTYVNRRVDQDYEALCQQLLM